MVKALPEISISTLRPSSTQQPAATVLDAPCQTTSKTGTQHQPLAERLPKIKIRSQTPQNTPPDMVLATRKTSSSLIHQNTGSSPLDQEANTTHCTNLSHWRQTQKQWELRTCSLKKRDPKHSKLSKMTRQRNT